jgi:DtxR family Mn-dependent transcriptional regulator
MLKRLKEKKLLTYQPYYGVKLNNDGRKVALSIIRRHRLWEFFLVTKLGFEWDKVHAIAEELEHVSNQELIQKLDRFLNHPQTDPHGDPIPDGNGKMPVIHQLSMADVVEKKKVIVSSVGNQSPAILELLNHYHINIGTEIKINQRFSFDGSIEIKVGKYAACIISELVAKNIFVYHD